MKYIKHVTIKENIFSINYSIKNYHLNLHMYVYLYLYRNYTSNQIPTNTHRALGKLDF